MSISLVKLTMLQPPFVFGGDGPVTPGASIGRPDYTLKGTPNAPHDLTGAGGVYTLKGSDNQGQTIHGAT